MQFNSIYTVIKWHLISEVNVLSSVVCSSSSVVIINIE